MHASPFEPTPCTSESESSSEIPVATTTSGLYHVHFSRCTLCNTACTCILVINSVLSAFSRFICPSSAQREGNVRSGHLYQYSVLQTFSSRRRREWGGWWRGHYCWEEAGRESHDQSHDYSSRRWTSQPTRWVTTLDIYRLFGPSNVLLHSMQYTCDDLDYSLPTGARCLQMTTAMPCHSALNLLFPTILQLRQHIIMLVGVLHHGHLRCPSSFKRAESLALPSLHQIRPLPTWQNSAHSMTSSFSRCYIGTLIPHL